MTDDSAPPDLAALRAQIDALDHEIIDVLARRMQVVSELSQVKRAAGLRVRDLARERRILDDRTSLGERRGLSRELIESTFRVIMRNSREYQSALKVEVPIQVEPKVIAIIGIEGAMGKRLAAMFRGLGHQVLGADVNTPLSAPDAARQADVTLIAVPIRATAEVIAQVGPHVPSTGLLMDVTSIKQEPLAAMLRATQASVLGTHPMFGPGVHTLQGQRVVLCSGRGQEWATWAEQSFLAAGLSVAHASAEEHDRAMALVQVLTHFQTQVLGLTLARLGGRLEESLRFTSPAYLIELYVAARHFAQDPGLYGPIEMENPRTAEVTEAFLQAADCLQGVLAARDQEAFERLFQEVRAFFGEFSAEATDQAGYLIDRVVERS